MVRSRPTLGGGYAETPVLGEYDSSRRSTIERQLAWATRHGVDWLSASWWGPQTWENRVLTTAFADEIRWTDVAYSLIYELFGRFDASEGGIDVDRTATRERLVADLRTMEREHFDHPNYRRIDGRPVVYLWPARALRGDVTAAIDAVRSALDTPVYVWGNFVSPNPPTGDDRANVRVFDAISMYNPYALWERIDGTDREFTAALEAHYRQWRAVAEGGDAHFYPTVVPRFDKTGTGSDLPVFPRDIEPFRADCRAVRTTVDAAVNTVVVTSFNEFHEGTHVEPTTEHGHAFLEVVRDELTAGEFTDPLADRTAFEFAFDRTNSPDGDARQLAFAATRLSLRDESGSIRRYDVGDTDGVLYGGGVYEAESDGSREWRWLGGPSGESRLFSDASGLRGPQTLRLEGRGFESGVEMSVSVGGRPVGRATLSGRWDAYEFSVPAQKES